MKSKWLVALLVVIILIDLTAYVVFNYFLVKEIKDIPFDFEVGEGNVAGFNLDKDKMHFGTTCAGCAARRQIIISNNRTYSEKVKFKVLTFNNSGAMFFSVNPPSGYLLKPGEEVRVDMTINIPKYWKLGKYEGMVRVEMFRALPREKNKPALPELNSCFSKSLLELMRC